MMRVCKMGPLCSPALCKQLDPSIYHVEIIASVINSPLTKQFMVNTRLTSCKLAVIELRASSVGCLKAFYLQRGGAGAQAPLWNVISEDEVDNRQS